MAVTSGSRLEVRNVTKSFPGVKVLKGVSFAIKPGEVHALVGENGAGKSTLIKILSGAIPFDSGEILLNGEPYRPTDPRSALALGVTTIYQEANLLRDRSVMHNVMLGRELVGPLGMQDFAAMRTYVRQALDTLGASHVSPDTTAGSLRVGEQQIIEIARALVNQSQVLIMDEPTSALNKGEVKSLFRIIDGLRCQGVSILYVSHRLDEVFELADTVTVLRDGQFVSTSLIANVTRDSLVADMVGRKVDSVFPSRSWDFGETVLEARHLTSAHAFADVSFALHRGEVLAITGLSGCGKTELAKALFGDYPVESGEILVRNKPTRMNPTKALANHMMFLPEDRRGEGVIQGLAVRRNLSLVMLRRLAGASGVINGRRERELAQFQVDRLSIKVHDLEQPCLTLSGGNQQKVALGKWLAAGAEIFVLMEPTQGIDVAVKFEIYDFISKVTRVGAAVILVSSEMPEVLGLAHHILVMNEGHVRATLKATETNAEEVLQCAL